MEWIIQSEKDLKNIATKIIPTLKKGDIVALEGDLGAGKTTFVRTLIRTLTSSDVEVPSPTFTLLQTYTTPNFLLYHFDFYRLKNPEEAYEIGIEEAFADGVSFIEWPQKIGSLLPKNHKTISIDILSNGSRRIVYEGET